MEVFEDKEKITDPWIERFLEIIIRKDKKIRSKNSDDLGDLRQGGQEEDLILADLKDLEHFKQGA